MADILDFRPTEGKFARQRLRGAAAPPSCEIVIFPGVRYDHWNAESNDQSKAARKRIKRDRLDLTE